MSSKDLLLCRVCGHKAKRTVNKVDVCEACRMFFVTHKKKGSNFECKKEECNITPTNRSISCNYCRFEKCKRVGMDPGFPVNKQDDLEETQDQPEKQLVVEEVLTPDKLAPERTPKEVEAAIKKQSNWLTENDDREKVDDESELPKAVEQVALKVVTPTKLTSKPSPQEDIEPNEQKKPKLLMNLAQGQLNEQRGEKAFLDQPQKKIVVEQVLTLKKLAPELVPEEVRDREIDGKQLNQLTQNDDYKKDESELQKAVEQVALQDETPAKLTPKSTPQEDFEPKEQVKPKPVINSTLTQLTQQTIEKMLPDQPEKQIVVEQVLTLEKLTPGLTMKEKASDESELQKIVQQTASQVLTPGTLTPTPQENFGPKEQGKFQPETNLTRTLLVEQSDKEASDQPKQQDVVEQVALQAHTSKKLTPASSVGDSIKNIGKQLSQSSKQETQGKMIDKPKLPSVVEKSGVGARITKTSTPAPASQKNIKTTGKGNQMNKQGNQEKEMKRESQQALQQPHLPVQAQQKTALKSTPEEVKSRIQTIFKVYKYCCPYASEKIKQIAQRNFGFNYNFALDVEDNRIAAWIPYSQLINEELPRLLYFIPRLQMTIPTDSLKYMFWQKAFVLFFAWVAPGISKKGFRYGDGQLVSREYLILLYGDDVAGKMITLADEIRELELNDHDMAMFISFLYFQPLKENDPLIGRVKTEEYNEVRDHFQQYESTEKLRFEDVAKLIPKFNSLNDLYKKEVGSYLVKNETSISTKGLFRAMFIDAPPA